VVVRLACEHICRIAVETFVKFRRDGNDAVVRSGSLFVCAVVWLYSLLFLVLVLAVEMIVGCS
jgi:hypothetical protein